MLGHCYVGAASFGVLGRGVIGAPQDTAGEVLQTASTARVNLMRTPAPSERPQVYLQLLAVLWTCLLKRHASCWLSCHA